MLLKATKNSHFHTKAKYCSQEHHALASEGGFLSIASSRNQKHYRACKSVTWAYFLFPSISGYRKQERHGFTSEGQCQSIASGLQSNASQLLQQRRLCIPIAQYCQTNCKHSNLRRCSNSFERLITCPCKIWPCVRCEGSQLVCRCDAIGRLR